MGSILTFDCGCMITLDAYPEYRLNNPSVIDPPRMAYRIDSPAWCAKHKDEIKDGFIKQLDEENIQMNKFIVDWYHGHREVIVEVGEGQESK